MSEAFLNDVDSDSLSIMEGEWSESITIRYRDSGGTEQEFTSTCIFDETYETVDPDTGAPVLSNYSRATLWEKEIEDEIGQEIAADEDDYWRAIVRDQEYYIKHPERDGTGLVLIDLKKI
jgi:hypothetical protein